MCSFQQFPIEYLEIPEDLTTEEFFEFEHTYIVPRENLTVNVTSLMMTVVLTGISAIFIFMLCHAIFNKMLSVKRLC